jgi:amino acid transporter
MGTGTNPDALPVLDPVSRTMDIGTSTAVGPPEVHTELREGALGLTGATMQAITHIAPAIAAFFFTAVVVGFAGVTAPLAYLVGVVIVLMLGSTLVQLSKHLPSAGGYYTYVSRAIHPRAGFLTSWMYVFYAPLAGGPIYGFFGFIVANELKANYNVNLPWLWWACIVAGAPLVAFLQYRGIKISARAMLILGGLEMLIVFAIGVWGFFDPAHGSSAFSVFNPSNVPALSGFALAVVFSVQGLTGWEGAAPLAEETADPKRNIPRSVVLSIVIIGVFLVITYWGVLMGWGTHDAKGLAGSSELPALVLAHRFWGGAWVIVLFAFLNSTIAVCLATANVGTRMWYGMARNGSFPKALAKVDPNYKTPVNAILLQMVLSLCVGIGVGVGFGADVSFNFVDGLILVLAVGVVYIMANVAVFMFYRRERPAEFKPLLHVVFPIISSAALIYAVYKSFQPAPASPYKWSPVVDGIWLLLGIGVLVWMRSRGREDWLESAGATLADTETR